MKNWVLMVVVGIVAVQARASVKLAGQVGKYKISMELVASTASKEFNIRGRYQYEGQTKYLDLQGTFYGRHALHLTESFEGKETGDFYLEESEEAWIGKWIGNSKQFDVWLKVESGNMGSLKTYSLEDCHEKATSAISGGYAVENYWINDYQYSDDSPVLEIGFNGGTAAFREFGSGDSIQFQFELVCGPTYHIASAGGVAHKVGNGQYLYKEVMEWGDGETCELVFTFVNKSVEITQKSSSIACGFGARAYADFSLDKVNDTVVIKEGELSSEGVQCR